MTQVFLLVKVNTSANFYTMKRLGDTEEAVSWKSKGLSIGKHTTPTNTDNSLSASIMNKIKMNKKIQFFV